MSAAGLASVSGTMCSRLIDSFPTMIVKEVPARSEVFSSSPHTHTLPWSPDRGTEQDPSAYRGGVQKTRPYSDSSPSGHGSDIDDIERKLR